MGENSQRILSADLGLVLLARGSKWGVLAKHVGTQGPSCSRAALFFCANRVRLGDREWRDGCWWVEVQPAPLEGPVDVAALAALEEKLKLYLALTPDLWANLWPKRQQIEHPVIRLYTYGQALRRRSQWLLEASRFSTLIQRVNFLIEQALEKISDHYANLSLPCQIWWRLN